MAPPRIVDLSTIDLKRGTMPDVVITIFPQHITLSAFRKMEGGNKEILSVKRLDSLVACTIIMAESPARYFGDIRLKIEL
ncbi:hypothetical protein C0989_008565 [Termitomyces sp. Mn162]|nr:hypothetical protein C0989_008565 [Termitomyces sp. Mn162]